MKMEELKDFTDEQLVDCILVVGTVRSDVILLTADVKAELLDRLQVRNPWPRVSPREMALDEERKA